jgi:predicted amidophosphoribosyltransferase
VWSDVVVRQKATPSQSTLSPIERKKNMQAAFAVPTPGNVAQRNILVVDDVHTTGATLTSLGMELYRAGASSVRFVTLAVAVDPTALAGNLLEVEQEAFPEQRI